MVADTMRTNDGRCSAGDTAMTALINRRLNMRLTVFAVGMNLYQFILLPVFFLPAHPLSLLSLFPCCLLSNSLWYLMHEAFHRNLHPDVGTNEAAGRLLSIFFGAPYRVVKFGHLMHHRFNGSPVERPDLYDPARMSAESAALRYYWGLCVGLYVEELLSGVLFCVLPQRFFAVVLSGLLKGDDAAAREMRESAAALLARRETRRAIRADGIATVVLLAASVACYGHFWFVVPLILMLRGFLISLANNIPHYGTANDDVRYALNVRLSRVMSAFYLHFNYHRVHHHDPRLPWTALPEAFQRSGETFDVGLSSAALRQFKGPSPLRAASDAQPT